MTYEYAPADGSPYRADFPLLARGGLIYLDSAATAQKPLCVLKAEQDFYSRHNANPMRGLYGLSVEATELYEDARQAVCDFLHAASPQEIVFTRNTTESLNLVAYSYGLSRLKPGDEIVVSVLEHHSNLLPWQMVARQTGAVLRFIECGPDGSISSAQLQAAFSPRTRLAAVAHVSNVLGCSLPIEQITAMAHERGAVVVLDAAQSAPHLPLDVQALDVDFAAFSGHKLMGPMGIGVLYGKKALLDGMPPFLSGGEMIEAVSRTGARFAPVPHKFEAGTVNAAGAAGLAAAIRYLRGVGFDEVQRIEHRLTALALDGLRALPHVHVLGAQDAARHTGILTFTVDGVHPHDVSAILDAGGIAVRAGHHCAQPLMQHLNVGSATRASLFFYNTEAEINAFVSCVGAIRRKMGYGA
ncbi:MAG: aminotransferase class V-fold PLP-dependent enzyme [Ruthenibacterium sp.]